jgi:hypothetical protein
MKNMFLIIDFTHIHRHLWRTRHVVSPGQNSLFRVAVAPLACACDGGTKSRNDSEAEVAPVSYDHGHQTSIVASFPDHVSVKKSAPLLLNHIVFTHWIAARSSATQSASSNPSRHLLPALFLGFQ